MINRIVRVIFDADLRCSHDGLRETAKKLKVLVDDLHTGEYVVFINSKKNMLKLFAANNTIAHFKTPDQRKMNLNVIAQIPKFFNGRELKYDDALKKVIEEQFSKRKN